MPRKPGFTLSEEHKAKIALAMTGNRNCVGKTKSLSVRKKISASRLKRKEEMGYLNSPEVREKMSKAMKGVVPWNKGGSFSEESRRKMSEAAKRRFANPENHPRWFDGKSFVPYTKEFTKQLKQKIRERDNFTCRLCGVKESDYFQKLSINHIDYDKSNCREDNLITLCRSCNSRVNSGRDYWTRLFKAKLLEKPGQFPVTAN